MYKNIHRYLYMHILVVYKYVCFTSLSLRPSMFSTLFLATFQGSSSLSTLLAHDATST